MNDPQNFANDSQNHPNDSQDFAADSQGLANDGQNLATDSQEIANDGQNLAADMQKIANDWPEFMNGPQEFPNGSPNLTSATQGVPDDVRNLEIGSQDFFNGPQGSANIPLEFLQEQLAAFIQSRHSLQNPEFYHHCEFQRETANADTSGTADGDANGTTGEITTSAANGAADGGTTNGAADATADEAVYLRLDFAVCNRELWCQLTAHCGSATAEAALPLFDLYSEVIEVYDPDSLTELERKLKRQNALPETAEQELDALWHSNVRDSVLREIDGITRYFHKLEEFCQSRGNEWVEVRHQFVTPAIATGVSFDWIISVSGSICRCTPSSVSNANGSEKRST